MCWKPTAREPEKSETMATLCGKKHSLEGEIKNNSPSISASPWLLIFSAVYTFSTLPVVFFSCSFHSSCLGRFGENLVVSNPPAAWEGSPGRLMKNQFC